MRENDRRERPLWVQVGLWGLPNRALAWGCFWGSAVFAVACIGYGFVDWRFFFGGVLVFAALWYFLAIRWVDRNDRWT